MFNFDVFTYVVHFTYFFVPIVLLKLYPRNHCQLQCHAALPLYFIALGLMFKSLIHFSVSFYIWYKGSSFILFRVPIQFSQHKLLKCLSFPYWMILALI